MLKTVQLSLLSMAIILGGPNSIAQSLKYPGSAQR